MMGGMLLKQKILLGSIDSKTKAGRRRETCLTH